MNAVYTIQACVICLRPFRWLSSERMCYHCHNAAQPDADYRIKDSEGDEQLTKRAQEAYK
jgi:hypothetical protein